jgi:uncharacterized protein YqgC (DUF456 family)
MILLFLLILTVVFGFIDKFHTITVENFYVLGAVVLVSIIVDFFSGVIGAKIGGAHWKSLVWGTFGLIVGTIITPIIGTIIGFFLGIFLSEYHSNRHHAEKAFKAALAGVIGALMGTLTNIIATLVFIVLVIVYIVT